MTKINILWISPTPLFPTNAGNRRHLKYMMETAEKNWAAIDFILYGWEKEAIQYNEQLKKKFNQFLYFQQPNKKNMTYYDYYGIDDWVSPEFMAFVHEKCINKKYDVVFIEYVWMSKIFEIFNNNVVKVLDTHDVFSNRDFLLEKQGIEKQWYFTRPDEEAKGIMRADIVLGITEDDCKYFENLIKNSSSKVLYCGSGVNPISVYISQNQKNITSKIAFGYIASSNALNRVSINKFLCELSKMGPYSSKFFINIGGSICPYVQNYDNLEIYKKGYIENVADFYKDIDIMLIPMLEGTGLKIKTIEAIENLKPFSATKYSTNDIPVNSIWHRFYSIEQMAKYLAKWINSDMQAKQRTIEYLRYQSMNIYNAIQEKQKIASEMIWSTIKESIKNKMSEIHIDSKMTNGIAVSIIIAAYNTEKYIDRCIKSILSDKMHNIEVIVINDGSTDSTQSIIEEIAKLDKRVKVINQTNSGQGVARNRGMDIASGEYLYFVDSDDYIGENSIFFMYQLCIEYNLDICSPDRPYLSNRPINYISALAGWCCFIKRSIVEQPFPIRQPAIRSGQDGVFANMVLTRCKSAMVCNKAKYFYEKREESTFTLIEKDLSIVPDLVEQHISSLRNFYELNNLFSTQTSRYILFLQDETYKFRFLMHIKKYSYNDALRVYLIVKSELKAHLKNIDNNTKKYLIEDFLSIEKLDFNTYMSAMV
ncbi:MAG: glycosyltransferase family 2 protein [Christensenellaceae bacterium]|jgi:glycosyltransferase involved in cell wall biosynthesis|nr:glycosyltransferase family 2 protein [Christensenellaceae bacterium]